MYVVTSAIQQKNRRGLRYRSYKHPRTCGCLDRTDRQLTQKIGFSMIESGSLMEIMESESVLRDINIQDYNQKNNIYCHETRGQVNIDFMP